MQMGKVDVYHVESYVVGVNTHDDTDIVESSRICV